MRFIACVLLNSRPTIAKFPRSWNFIVPKPVHYFRDTIAANEHGKNLTDDARGFGVGYKVRFVLRVCDIPVGNGSVDYLAALCLCLFGSAYFL